MEIAYTLSVIWNSLMASRRWVWISKCPGIDRGSTRLSNSIKQFELPFYFITVSGVSRAASCMCTASRKYWVYNCMWYVSERLSNHLISPTPFKLDEKNLQDERRFECRFSHFMQTVISLQVKVITRPRLLDDFDCEIRSQKVNGWMMGVKPYTLIEIELLYKVILWGLIFEFYKSLWNKKEVWWNYMSLNGRI